MDRRKLVLMMLLMASVQLWGQTLTLPDAIRLALDNYESIKAKQSYIKASKAKIQESKRDYLPELKLSAQQSYGTINAQNGPMHGFGGLGVASSSVALAENNWNAAFGALYLANVSWDFFTFGQVTNKIKLAKIGSQKREAELEQELFQHQIKVIGAYLNLLAMQRLVAVQESNVIRAEVVLKTVLSLTDNELKPKVDASQARAELSNAKILLIHANEKESELAKQLALLIGLPYQTFQLDSHLIELQPYLSAGQEVNLNHPLLMVKQRNIDLNVRQSKLLKSEYFPRISLFGVIQGRGSGFEYNYPQNNNAYSRKYSDGIKIDRSNYLVGVGMTWSVSSLFRNRSKVNHQRFATQALQEEYKLLKRELTTEVELADDKIGYALEHKQESPIQVEAATVAYNQQLALYSNGLTNISDLAQASYTLNRAESDLEIAAINVWQALLLKASATGELNLFMDAINR